MEKLNVAPPLYETSINTNTSQSNLLRTLNPAMIKIPYFYER